ncbi:MAG: DUF4445 domain-containing protein [Thermoplasmata archaeon]|nr:DUF4445 domain-containing protein [Thermoplasmata archaeon]TFG70992.1 MAG: DUF4445 domain-containing protein [Methanomassiliicoccus sp.]
MTADEGRNSLRVVFRPDGKQVTVDRGTTVLEAGRLACIPIDAVCGGNGKCGRCKVKIDGKTITEGSEHLTEEEVREGITLACTSRIEGDLIVHVLPRYRLGKHQIVTKSVQKMPKRTTPWVTKRFLEMNPATLSDNLADRERMMRAMDDARSEISLEGLRDLPSALRDGRWKVTATQSDLAGPVEIIRVEPGDTRGSAVGIAVDIGTTTVVVDLIDLDTGEVLGTASDFNRQMTHGDDVIARMMFGEENGLDELTSLARETVNSCIKRVMEERKEMDGERLSRQDIVAASIAGNTVMTQFFLGLSTDHVRLEPYVPVTHHIPPMKAKDLGLMMNGAGSVFTFPSRAGYVGGDVIADVLASEMHRSKRTHLLIDVGTNGEVVLGCRDWMVSCSCSAGPAFEGGEVACGVRAMDGAIDRLRIDDDLAAKYHVIGDQAPIGVCGSGLVDLMAEMYARGVIDRKARIQERYSDRVRTGEEGLEYVIERKERLHEGATSDLVITDADLQNILRTKAAIYGACSVLLRKTGKDLESLSSIVIAGGFGFHLDMTRAVTLGMFPDVPRKKYRFIGNGALGGAKLALVSKDARRETSKILKKMTYLELSVDNEFYEEFSASLFIPHTDLGRFPSANHANDWRDVA